MSSLSDIVRGGFRPKEKIIRTASFVSKNRDLACNEVIKDRSLFREVSNLIVPLKSQRFSNSELAGLGKKIDTFLKLCRGRTQRSLNVSRRLRGAPGLREGLGAGGLLVGGSTAGALGAPVASYAGAGAGVAVGSLAGYGSVKDRRFTDKWMGALTGAGAEALGITDAIKMSGVLDTKSDILKFPVTKLTEEHPETLEMRSGRKIELANHVYNGLQMTMGLMSIVTLSEGKSIVRLPNNDVEIEETIRCIRTCNEEKCQQKRLGGRASAFVSSIYTEETTKKDKKFFRLAFRGGRRCTSRFCKLNKEDFRNLSSRESLCLPKSLFSKVGPEATVQVISGTGENWKIVGKGVFKWLWMETLSSGVFLSKKFKIRDRNYSLHYIGTFMYFDPKGVGAIKTAQDLLGSKLIVGRDAILDFFLKSANLFKVDPRSIESKLKDILSVLPADIGVNVSLLDRITYVISQTNILHHIVTSLKTDPFVSNVKITLYGFSLGAAQALLGSFIFETLIRSILQVHLPSSEFEKIDRVKFNVFGAPRIGNKPFADHMHELCHRESFNVTLAVTKKIGDKAYVLPDPVISLPPSMPGKVKPDQVWGNVAPNVILLQNPPSAGSDVLSPFEDDALFIQKVPEMFAGLSSGNINKDTGISRGSLLQPTIGDWFLHGLNSVSVYGQLGLKGKQSSKVETSWYGLWGDLHNLWTYEEALLGTLPTLVPRSVTYVEGMPLLANLYPCEHIPRETLLDYVSYFFKEDAMRDLEVHCGPFPDGKKAIPEWSFVLE